MILKKIYEKPNESLIYLERYVNDGSPSGFSKKHNTSSMTNPFGNTPFFSLPYLRVQKEHISDNNDTSFLLNDEIHFSNNLFYIHPDMLSHEDIKEYDCFQSSLNVIPTSSSRTVQILTNNSNYYLKLHYDGIIGRINRSLPYQKAISGFEISKIIENGINNNKYPKYFGIFRERAVRTLHLSENKTWCFIYREGLPYSNDNSAKIFLPFFALFSKDSLTNGQNILSQLYDKFDLQTYDIVLELIIKRIIECYFSLIINEGLQFELNAQNVLIGFDDNYLPCSIFFRDLMGFEKDLTIREEKLLSNDFLSAPYKYISRSIDEKLYQIRHSFAFDFKLSKYIVEPLLNSLKEFEKLNDNSKDAIKSLQKYCRSFIKQLDDTYFPENGLWYFHKNELLTNKRIYYKSSKPLLR